MTTTTASIAGVDFFHLDVFADRPLTGNGLIVFPDAGGLDGDTMALLTGEMRQFESIFLVPDARTGSVRARIFTAEEELGFAGHPILGAAVVQHHLHSDATSMVSTFELDGRSVEVTTTRRHGSYSAVMDQGPPRFGDPVGDDRIVGAVVDALGLDRADLAADLPLRVVSTGLPYLLVPLGSGLERVSITHPDFASLLREVGASFCYPFDVERREGRSFDNRGSVEDVATGSAAGPAGAYLVDAGRAEPDTPIVIHQGRFLNRPSQMTVTVGGTRRVPGTVTVGGDVTFVGSGRLGEPPRTTPPAS